MRLFFETTPYVYITINMRPYIVLMSIILHVILAIAVILLFGKMHGLLIYTYLGSVIASFLLPLFFGSFWGLGYYIIPHANFEWLFDGFVNVIVNLLIGPAMVILQSFCAMKLFKKCSKSSDAILQRDSSI
jgi:hypothetical protein